MKTNILITGATGNIGHLMLKHITEQDNDDRNFIPAVRSVTKLDKETASRFECRTFDFENQDTYHTAFQDIDILFLLRPPHIADVEKYFIPLLDAAKRHGIRKIIFLSVQGADKRTFIPHAKIEKEIIRHGFEYIFLRPSYFMQNLATTLRDDLSRGCICLPSGNALFNWVDADDIARAATMLLEKFDCYKNKAFEITGPENIGFSTVAELINKECGTKLRYRKMNVIQFFIDRKKQGMPTDKILVMIMLHFLPRLEKAPGISGDYKEITGINPTNIKEYIRRDCKILKDAMRLP